MPKGSKELTQARKEEIVSACAELYKTMSFKEITMKEIGEATSSFFRKNGSYLFTTHSDYRKFREKHLHFIAECDNILKRLLSVVIYPRRELMHKQH